jgi:hypothetical protein
MGPDEELDASSRNVDDFPHYAQPQSCPVFFALVESIRGR